MDMRKKRKKGNGKEGNGVEEGTDGKGKK